MIIIGGGSAGLFLAIKRAEQNNINNNSNIYKSDTKEKQYPKIIVVEEHSKLGQPVQCTGILTDDIYSLIKKNNVNKFTTNIINKTKIFSQNNSVELKLKNNIIIDNVKFIEYLAEKAEKLDVKILTNHKYISNNGKEIKIKAVDENKTKDFTDSILIGADGPLSKVAMQNNLCKNRSHLLGVQARIQLDEPNNNSIDFYPHIGEYAWSTPENKDVSRIGLAIPLARANLKDKLFNDLLKKYPGKKLELQAGLIPLYNPKNKIVKTTQEFSVALVGDAALQIKNTTGGGIIPGLKAASELSFGLNSYNKNLKKLNKELYIHYLLNKSFRKYDDKDWDRLIFKVKDEKIKSIIEQINRDNSNKLIFALAKKRSMISEGLRALVKLV